MCLIKCLIKRSDVNIVKFPWQTNCFYKCFKCNTRCHRSVPFSFCLLFIWRWTAFVTHIPIIWVIWVILIEYHCMIYTAVYMYIALRRFTLLKGTMLSKLSKAILRFQVWTCTSTSHVRHPLATIDAIDESVADIDERDHFGFLQVLLAVTG